MISCSVQFLKYSTRVCAGYMLDDLRMTKGEDYKIDSRVYLILRGQFFSFIGMVGIAGLIAFLYLGKRQSQEKGNNLLPH